MKRFSPYTKYTMNGKNYYSFVNPGTKEKKECSEHLIDDQIRMIRSMFLPRFKFKRCQEEIMRDILSGSDTFALLPTGSGKSLCFQAPSVFFPGITLVVTPLIALIENQVYNFNAPNYPLVRSTRKKGNKQGIQDHYFEKVRFRAIYPGMNGMKEDEMFAEILNPLTTDGGREVQYKLLYVSPERLCNPKFLRALNDAEEKGLLIPHVVIDEAHCMSQWGFDFRESYLHIAGFIQARPMRPIISAFTATATPKDRAEIKYLLGFPTDENEYAKKKYAERFYMEKRRNLTFRVERCSDYAVKEESGDDNTGKTVLKTRMERLVELLLENQTKVCIIYRTTAAGVDELYNALQKNETLRDRLAKYHAQMSKPQRSKSKAGFLAGHHGDDTGKNILIATKAFGMGIDKDDISLIIHYDMPRSLEDYYQEAGRAGRNSEKVPMAHCFLLYSEGPIQEKGTLQYMIQWVFSERKLSRLSCLPISSQFSPGMREQNYFWSYYRLCCMRAYCLSALYHPGQAQDFVIRYLDKGFSFKESIQRLSSFYNYIIHQYPVPDPQCFLKEHVFESAEAGRFLGFRCSGTKQKTDAYHKELRQLINQVNELYINNTYAANLLRDRPDQYCLNEPYSSDADPDCRLNEKELTFTIYGDEKLTYFDMCVLDAVYSIETARKKAVYVQTIWEILTGRNPRYSSRERNTFRTEIRKSIDKMRSTFLSLSDRSCGFQVERECFLPLRDKAEEEKGFAYTAIPPLFRYAETKNGQLLNVPVSLFNVSKIEKSALWKSDLEIEYKHGGAETLDGTPRHGFDYYVKYLPLEKDVPDLENIMEERDYQKLEKIRTRTYGFSPSLENVLLCHYLIRRISISEKRYRADFIRFSTIQQATGTRTEACLFHKKAAAVMDHYRKIGYLSDFGLYITHCTCRLTNGDASTRTVYFRLQVMDTVKYWQYGGMNHLLFSDFLTEPAPGQDKGDSDGNGEKQPFSAAAKRALAQIPLARMDGMVLRHG